MAPYAGTEFSPGEMAVTSVWSSIVWSKLSLVRPGQQEWSRVKEGQATVGKLLTSSLDPFPPPSLAYSPSLSNASPVAKTGPTTPDPPHSASKVLESQVATPGKMILPQENPQGRLPLPQPVS